MTHPPLLRFRVRDCDFRLLLVEGGAFRMGSDKASDPDAFEDETPPHEVRVPPFYLAPYPVTQALWQAVTDEDPGPSYFAGAGRPVEQVSWDDVRPFLDKLEKKTGTRFRLPTEAEWEFAARGGTYGGAYAYAGSGQLKEVAWYARNSHGETKPAGLKCPNELGLYDMSGNVWEWCEDQWHSRYKGAPNDGSAWTDREEGSNRVNRGGCWLSTPRGCRAAARSYWQPGNRYSNLGFRLALSLQAVGGRRAGL